MDTAQTPGGEPEAAPAKIELPAVESPPLSPASEVATPAPAESTAVPESIAIAPEPVIVAPAVEAPAASASVSKLWPRLTLRPRHKRYAVLAASVTFAAALGAVIGALASSGSAPQPPAWQPDVATVQQNKAMEQSIAKLNKEIAALKTNLDQAAKTAHTQIAKISEKLEHQTADITGSIAAPQTVPVAPQAAAAPALEPVPLPRPAQRMAAVETPPAPPHIVPGWSIFDYRGGYVFVQNRGEVFRVAIGAPLPGLGPVQSVRREDGRWTVVTPRGLIVSQRERRYWEDD
jgi:hypothetical protein